MDPEQTFIRVQERFSQMLRRKVRAALEYFYLFVAITLFSILVVMHANYVQQCNCLRIEAKPLNQLIYTLWKRDISCYLKGQSLAIIFVPLTLAYQLGIPVLETAYIFQTKLNHCRGGLN